MVPTSEIVSAVESFVFFLLPMIIQTFHGVTKTRDAANFQPSMEPQASVFEFIIVGGGAAGSVLANRLSSPQNNYSVLLLEAGGDPNHVTTISGLDFLISGSPEIDWMYWSRPDIEKNSCLSCLEKKTRFSMGLGLGGGTNLNFLVYHRGNKKDWDFYAEATGDPSWSYKYMLERFKSFENYKGPYPNPKFHGCGGELEVSESLVNSGASYIASGLHDIGFTEKDHSDNSTFSYQKMEYTAKKGRRWGSYKAFLEPVLNRKNLKILRFSQVTKVIFDEKDPKKVVGVEYRRHGRGPYKAFASKEVVLSAGTYNSAKILMLSGIGVKADLEKLKIPVVQDLPVGRNFHDHIFSYSFFEMNNNSVPRDPTIVDLPQEEVINVPQNVEANYSVTSPWAGNLLSIQAHYSSPYNIDKDPSWPDLQYMICNLYPWNVIPTMLQKVINLDASITRKYLEGATSKEGFVVVSSLNKPQSIGSVTLNPENPTENPPIVNLNRFSDSNDHDLNASAHAIEFLKNVFDNTQTFKKVQGKIVDGHWPGCENFTLHSHEYFKCHGNGWHPSGTCKMGRPSDSTSVVDSRLRVRGVKGLRVMDLSILPKIVSGNTQAAAMAIGDKGAEMLIEDWQGVPRSSYH